ncbi:MAG: alpha/beta-type small acid-soluble spore protein [Treponema sp.]|nr:alpha/beta-type small acid-soluble spore protein [Treponema sp.]
MNDNIKHTGKVGGHVVKHMIEDVENKMANGEHVSAGPPSEGDIKALQDTREKNRKSGR